MENDLNDPGDERPLLEMTEAEEFFNESQEQVDNSFSKATSGDLQWGRRLFHFSTGTTVATFYGLLLTHQQVIYILGFSACLLYLMEQVRVSYPELGRRLIFFNNFLLRAEEQLKESSAIPYAMAILLTTLTFPKSVAMIAIYTLAIADPMAAIVGILFGKKKLSSNKTLEGSLAFFTATFLCALGVLANYQNPDQWWLNLQVAFAIGLFATLVEMVPMRLDDNLTIPLYTAILSWLFMTLGGISVV